MLYDCGIIGNFGVSLYVKIFSIDGKMVFIGFFNFDLCLILFNIEMGFVIESEMLV